MYAIRSYYATKRPSPKRRTGKKLLPLKESTPAHLKMKESDKISMLLDQNSNIDDLVLQDLGTTNHVTGAA